MSYKDKTMTCADCNQPFVHSAQDQEFFAQKGYTNEPRRCPNCRGARRAGSSGGGGSYGSSGGGYAREMHNATCAECGQACQVPFEPRQDRPVYCSACYSKQRSTSSSGGSYGGGRSDGSRW